MNQLLKAINPIRPHGNPPCSQEPATIPVSDLNLLCFTLLLHAIPAIFLIS